MSLYQSYFDSFILFFFLIFLKAFDFNLNHIHFVNILVFNYSDENSFYFFIYNKIK